MVPGFQKNSNLNSGYGFMLSGLISCAAYVVLIKYWAGAFHGKTKVPCICTLSDFIFQTALRHKSETLLFKCIIQISGQDRWHFCALTGKCAVGRPMGGCRGPPQRLLTARVDAKAEESWARRDAHLLGPRVISAALLAPTAAGSAAWGRFGVRAPQDGGVCSSVVQEHLPRFPLLLCKQDSVPADRHAPSPSSRRSSQRKPGRSSLAAAQESFASCFALPAEPFGLFLGTDAFCQPYLPFPATAHLSRMMSRELQTC